VIFSGSPCIHNPVIESNTVYVMQRYTETKSPYSTFQAACLSKRSELMQIKFPTY